MAEDLTARDARLAAEIEPDVATEQVAIVYAEALLAAAEKADQTEALLEEFDSFLVDVLDHFPALEEILDSRVISHDETSEILDHVFGGRASELLLNFLKVVSRHGRLECLRAIHRQLHEQYDRLRGRVRVELATPTPLDDALAGRIAEGLEGLLGAKPVLRRVTDPDLIGGAVLRIGDTVYDGSVATQLQIVRQQMIDRSVHEIQARRDRFRYPAGN